MSYFDKFTESDAIDMATQYLKYEVDWLCQSPAGMLAAESALEEQLEFVRQRIVAYAATGAKNG